MKFYLNCSYGSADELLHKEAVHNTQGHWPLGYNYDKAYYCMYILQWLQSG